MHKAKSIAFLSLCISHQSSLKIGCKDNAIILYRQIFPAKKVHFSQKKFILLNHTLQNRALTAEWSGGPDRAISHAAGAVEWLLSGFIMAAAPLEDCWKTAGRLLQRFSGCVKGTIFITYIREKRSNLRPHMRFFAFFTFLLIHFVPCLAQAWRDTTAKNIVNH